MHKREKILGLDLGTKSLGISMSDDLNLLATGIENYFFPEYDFDNAINYLKTIVEKYNAKIIILGLPLNMSGSESESSTRSRFFKDLIEKSISNVDVILIDERRSSVSANQMLIELNYSRKKRKKVIDKLASTIILQNYLDSIKK